MAALVALTTVAQAQIHRRRQPKQDQSAPTSTSAPVDKRDRAIAATGTPFNGRPFWQAAAQCGGIYFKLGSIYSEAAARAKVVKPDPAAYTQLTKQADDATKNATAFFVVAERFLMSDRKLQRDDAVMTYDPVSNANGDRVKTAEGAIQAAKPCAELYQICRASFAQTCNDTAVLTRLTN